LENGKPENGKREKRMTAKVLHDMKAQLTYRRALRQGVGLMLVALSLTAGKAQENTNAASSGFRQFMERDYLLGIGADGGRSFRKKELISSSSTAVQCRQSRWRNPAWRGCTRERC